MPTDWAPSNGQLNTEKSGKAVFFAAFFPSEFN